mgnify:CR=1 FL=1
MTGGMMFWNGTRIPFRAGDSVATALVRAGVRAFGVAPAGQARAVFCGIGLCQGCLSRGEGRLTEACLLPAREGLHLFPESGGGQDV